MTLQESTLNASEKPRVSTPKVQPFDADAQRYDDWFSKNRCAYLSELRALQPLIGDSGVGIEIGIGSGKFAKPLCLSLGIEPSREMRKIAHGRELSGWYDWLAGHIEKKHREDGLRKLDVRKGERVLEIGFGTGQSILALAETVGDTGRVYGLDISEGMLKITQERIEKAGLSQRVDLRLGDATRLPFESNSLDAVFMSFVLELFDTPEIPIVLEECKRVLRTGGRICVAAMSKQEKPSLAEKLYEWMHEVPQLC